MKNRKCKKCGIYQRMSENIDCLGNCIDRVTCSARVDSKEYDRQLKIEQEKRERNLKKMKEEKKEQESFGGAVPHKKINVNSVRSMTASARVKVQQQYEGK